uniref:Uncharacterized protein n=1 Tax=Aegilops tauschii subsp. strangulata TaxID=200361 RepID=A0A453TEU1_AEGTS
MRSPDNNFVQQSFTTAIADEHIRQGAPVCTLLGSAGTWYGIDGLFKRYMILVEFVPFVSCLCITKLSYSENLGRVLCSF